MNKKYDDYRDRFPSGTKVRMIEVPPGTAFILNKDYSVAGFDDIVAGGDTVGECVRTGQYNKYLWIRDNNSAFCIEFKFIEASERFSSIAPDCNCHPGDLLHFGHVVECKYKTWIKEKNKKPYER